MSRLGAQRDLVPLAARLGVLHALRLALAVVVLVIAVAAPERVPGGLQAVAGVTSVYLLLTLAVELWRSVRGVPLFIVGVMLLADGLYIALVQTLTGGPASGLAFLVQLHLIAVTLLASYRTGLKLALWHSLLLVVAAYAPPSLLGGREISLRAAVFSASTFWAVAIATAAFSALNERELRRSRSGFRSLATMATELERVDDSENVIDVLLRAVAGNFATQRVAVLTAQGAPTIAVLSQGNVVRAATDTDIDAVVRRCWEEKAPVLVAHLDDDRQLGALLPGARNLVVVPMVADRAPVGALVVEHGGILGARIPAADVNLLVQFAAHAALAHRNALLLDEVTRLASVDGLTGLANRRAFESALVREVDRALRLHLPLSLLLLDIDHFKQVNDEHGHQLGDEVLRHLGRVLASDARSIDLPARYGGEEFAILLPGCSAEDGVAAAERLRLAVGVDAPLPVTISVGVATVPGHASDPQGLVAAADAALYDAKLSGRDRTCVARRRLELVSSNPHPQETPEPDVIPAVRRRRQQLARG